MTGCEVNYVSHRDAEDAEGRMIFRFKTNYKRGSCSVNSVGSKERSGLALKKMSHTETQGTQREYVWV